jgi:glycosyltransferase involved in cell wall biosynthesis
MNIAIVGHFGGHKKFNDGQTIKTNTIYESLSKIKKIHVDRVDTYYIKRYPFLFFWQLMKSIVRDEKYIILLSSNGRKFLFPIFYFLSKYFNKHVFHYAIGGRLAREVSNNKNWKKYVNSFRGNWVESTSLTQELQNQGVTNAVYIPNFKCLKILQKSQNLMDFPPFHFCMFCRVMPEKGIGDAIDAITSINRKHKCNIALLDIYGPIEKNYRKQFQVLVDSTEVVSYCGVVSSNESVNALKPYFALLFPTHWKHEGIPGTIIDALTSGIPIIARRWEYCNEMITDGETGYVYDFDRPELLKKCIEKAIADPIRMIEMKPNCIAKSKYYSEEYVMKKICNQLGI